MDERDGWTEGTVLFAQFVGRKEPSVSSNIETEEFSQYNIFTVSETKRKDGNMT